MNSCFSSSSAPGPSARWPSRRAPIPPSPRPVSEPSCGRPTSWSTKSTLSRPVLCRARHPESFAEAKPSAGISQASCFPRSRSRPCGSPAPWSVRSWRCAAPGAPRARAVVLMNDVVVVGGGPAGLAVAIASRLAGLSVEVLDRASPPIDKACGEGLMPDGAALLDRWGVRLAPSESARFVGIRFIDGGLAGEWALSPRLRPGRAEDGAARRNGRARRVRRSEIALGLPRRRP